MLTLGTQCVNKVYTEQFRSTQSLHRANPVNTESTQSDLGSTQSLHRGIPTYKWSTQKSIAIYTESTQKKMEFTQSLCGST